MKIKTGIGIVSVRHACDQFFYNRMIVLGLVAEAPHYALQGNIALSSHKLFCLL